MSSEFDEEDLLPISALQHLVFCPRQWGLIHLEGIWDENPLTVEGRRMHERADEPATEVRGDVRIARGLRLRSLRLGLTGKADVVEFHRLEAQEAAGASLPGCRGRWRPFPVEYKRGRPKRDRCDEVQLCAQALCLEEMLDVGIASGALFYGRTNRRIDVDFDAALRTQTEALAARLHELTRRAETPPAQYTKGCEKCSLLAVCLPRLTGRQNRSARAYLEAFIESQTREE